MQGEGCEGQAVGCEQGFTANRPDPPRVTADKVAKTAERGDQRESGYSPVGCRVQGSRFGVLSGACCL